MFILLSLVAVLLCGVASGEKNVICYYGSWATYRNGIGKYDVSNINTNLCTHIIYSFVGIDNNGNVVSLDPWLDLPDNWGRDNFGALNRLKANAPHLKTILAVGGWSEGSAKYSVMAASPALRRNFINTALQMVLRHGFDGFDVDWEYPNKRDTVHGWADVDNFTQLLRELREEFNKHGLLLSAAVSSVRSMASDSYNIPEISRYLDFINIMTYDMYGDWNPVTGHNAPLHSGLGDQGQDPQSLFTVDVALQYWISAGAPPEKLLVGVPFYGRSFRLVESNNAGVRAPANGPGLGGPFTGADGFLGYNEFCYKQRTESWNQLYDHLAKVPYATGNGHNRGNWVSYDDANSIIAKIDYVMKYNINGIMIWSIDTDDFNGVCGQGSYPLLRAINWAVGRNVREPNSSTSAPSTSTIAPSSTSSPASSTNPAPGDYVCTQEGIDGNPSDCSTFFICIINEDGSMKGTKFECPEPLLFDINNKVCNYAHSAVCAT